MTHERKKECRRNVNICAKLTLLLKMKISESEKFGLGTETFSEWATFHRPSRQREKDSDGSSFNSATPPALLTGSA